MHGVSKTSNIKSDLLVGTPSSPAASKIIAASKIMQSEFSGSSSLKSVLILETRPSASGSPAGGGEPF